MNSTNNSNIQATDLIPKSKQWYAIRVTYNREMKVKEDLDAKNIENFIPMQYKYVKRGNKVIKKLAPSVHNLIFIRIEKEKMVEYKATTTLPIRYIMDSEKKSPVVIPDKQMASFIAVAGQYDEQLIYLDHDPGLLNKGDKVRVIGGIFEGAEGTFMRIKGDRRVVVAIPGIVAVATANIHRSLLEKIEN